MENHPVLFSVSKNHVIPSQCSHYYALRAAFGGCALYMPAGLVVWEFPGVSNIFG